MVFTPEAPATPRRRSVRQIMLGSDHPFVSSTSVDYIFATTTLSDDEKVAILGGNAAKLLGIKA